MRKTLSALGVLLIAATLLFGQNFTTGNIVTQTILSSVSHSLGTGYLSETRVVSTGLTTTTGLLVKTDAGVGTVSTSALEDTNVSGIAITSQTAGQNVEVAVSGIASCVADADLTAGQLLIPGTNTAGRCEDFGGATNSTQIPNQIQIVGRALADTAEGALAPVELFPQGTFGVQPTSLVIQRVAAGTSALGTGAIASGTCATVVTTSATGAVTADNLIADFSADPTATTGYAPVATGMLTIIKYLTTDNVNFKVCNLTADSITPGAVTLRWIVAR